MENSNGGLYFNAGIDISKLSEDARSAKEMLKSISTEAIKDGGVIDNAFAGVTLQELSGKITKVSESLKELRFDTVEEKIASLSLVIKDSEQAILSHNDNIQKWKEEAQEAFAKGDFTTFNTLTAQISESSTQMQEIIEQTHQYADALDAVKSLEGIQGGAKDTIRLYDSEKDLMQVKALEEEIQRLNSELRTATSTGADTSGLQAQLQAATTKLNDLNTSAANTASSLGNELAARAMQAQQELAALNVAIREQDSIISDLKGKVETESAALEALKNSETASQQEIDIAAASLNFYKEALTEATNEMSLLKGAQVDAQSQWRSVSDEVQKHDSVIVKMMGGYDNYQTVLSKLPAPLQSVIGGITGMTGAAKAFIATPLGAIIAAIVLALQALYSWFNSSVEGQKAFAQISGYVTGVLGQLKEIVITAGKAIYNAFKDPQQAVKDLWDVIKTNIVNRFKALGQLASHVGEMISAAFTPGESTSEAWGKIKDDLLQLGTGVENLTDKVSNWANGVHQAAKATSEIAVANKELEIQASEWQKRSAELDKQKASAMAKIYDTSLSKAERDKAMKEYKEALTEQTNTELELQKKRIALQERSMSLTTNSIEDENKLRELQAQAIQIEARHEQQLASLTRRQNSLNNAGKTAESKADSEAARKAIAQMNMSEFERKAMAEQREAALAMEQARIDGMKDGFEKTLAQNRLNWEKLRDDNAKRAESYVKEYRDKLFQDYLNENPNATKGQQAKYKLFLETEINADSLPDTLKQILKDYEKMADEALTQSNKESMDKMLQDVMTYEQQRTKIVEEYARKRKGLYDKNEDGSTKTDADGNPILRKGVTQGNLEELKRQEDEALKSIDEQFAQREETYQAWCEMIANMALKNLETVLEEAKKKLEELESSGSKDEKALADARAKVNKAQDAVNKAKAKNDLDPGKRTMKEWEDLYKTLNDVEKEFESIGDTVGGVVGDIISDCGKMATSTLSMINGIMTLANWSVTATKMTAEGASKSIQSLEKASVILTVISAAMEIAVQIANLFNSDEKKQKEIDSLQKRIDQLQWELDNQEIGRVQAQYGTAISRLNNALVESRREIAAGTTGWERFYVMSLRASRSTELMQKTAEKLATSYANVAYSADKAFKGAKYDNATDQLKNIAQQQILIQEQINAESSKKKSDKGAIKEWEQKIEELGQQAIEIINEMVEDIIGDTSTGIAEQLSDAFFDAFQAGEDYAEAWGDKVNDIVADVMKRMLISKFLEEPLGQIFDKYKSRWFKDGQFQGLDSVINSMEGFASDLNAVGADFAEIWENLPDSVKGMFKITDDAAREASQQGIATASQESVDELNGRTTAIQGHTFSIMENMKLLLSCTQSILISVMNIERETEGQKECLSKMESHLKETTDTLGDIATKGIRLKD